MNHKQYNGLGIIFGYQNTQQYVAEANEKCNASCKAQKETALVTNLAGL
jgi:hypothetical protein